eukprot:1150868-Pelagomonas_calceolata.AAC.3
MRKQAISSTWCLISETRQHSNRMAHVSNEEAALRQDGSFRNEEAAHLNMMVLFRNEEAALKQAFPPPPSQAQHPQSITCNTYGGKLPKPI